MHSSRTRGKGPIFLPSRTEPGARGERHLNFADSCRTAAQVEALHLHCSIRSPNRQFRSPQFSSQTPNAYHKTFKSIDFSANPKSIVSPLCVHRKLTHKKSQLTYNINVSHAQLPELATDLHTGYPTCNLNMSRIQTSQNQKAVLVRI